MVGKPGRRRTFIAAAAASILFMPGRNAALPAVMGPAREGESIPGIRRSNFLAKEDYQFLESKLIHWINYKL